MTEDAYARGLAEGRAQALAESAMQTAAAVRDLADRLDGMTAERSRALDTVTAEAGRALATVVRSLCPGLSVLGLADRARHLLENELLAAPRPVTIRAAPDVAGALDGMGTGIAVESDDAMPVTRLDLSWPEGGATVDAEALASRIMGLADTLDPRRDPVEENPHD